MVQQGSLRRVLVVHDEPVFTAVLTKGLRSLGFAVEIAIDGEAAQRRIEDAPPDLVCVTLSLPRDSGYDLCESIRKDPALDHVQIMVFSDIQSPAVVAQAEEVGANAFLRQPFDFDVLAQYVTAMLEAPRVRRSGVPSRRRAGGGLAAE
jgi:two-component system chemotaxis response regulator CheY